MVEEYIALMEQKPVLVISFSEALERARNGRIAVFPCMAKTPERSEYLSFSRPYTSCPLVMLTWVGEPFISRLEDLSGRLLAVVKACKLRGPGRQRPAGAARNHLMA